MSQLLIDGCTLLSPSMNSKRRKKTWVFGMLCGRGKPLIRRGRYLSTIPRVYCSRPKPPGSGTCCVSISRIARPIGWSQIIRQFTILMKLCHPKNCVSRHRLDKVRIDKWLWAARFFKTRSLAKQAIEGGKVHCDDQRVKPSKEVALGLTLRIRQGFDERTGRVTELSDQHRREPEAALLYEETAESLAAREEEAARRKAARSAQPFSDHRPNKKERRQIHRFQNQHRDG